MDSLRGLVRLLAAVPIVLACAARADIPRAELGVGVWDHGADGTLTSDDPLLQVPAGFELQGDRQGYQRLGVRLGSAWWAPVLRVRHAQLNGEGTSFVDNSTYVGGVLVNLDTTGTRTETEFEPFEGLLYFTYGETVRGELGGGLVKMDGSVKTAQRHETTLGGVTTASAERDLSTRVGVAYGAVFIEPASWLSFGGEAVGSTGSDPRLLDYSLRVVIKPWTWVGVEGGYRRLAMKVDDVNAAAYDFTFAGAYAGLSLLYGSKDAGLLSPDADGDGVSDRADRCPHSTPGAAVDVNGCEPDVDADGVPDGRDDCRATPKGAQVDASGCTKDLDHDAVADGLDECPNTPAGVAVDARGCPQDRDGDGVPDDKDRCADTAAGVQVGADGCALQPAAAAAPAAPVAPAAAAPAPDDDHDGVPDGIDECAHTLPGLKVDPTGCATASQETVLQGITFLKNSSYLQRDSEVLLLQVIETLKAQPTMRVVIQGHTCDLGDAKYNKWLSQRRADRVLEFLVRHGIAASRLLAVGYGEEQPMVPNDDERMRELNRRTVFAVVER